MQDKVIVGSEEWCSFPARIPTIKAVLIGLQKHPALHTSNIVAFER